MNLGHLSAQQNMTLTLSSLYNINDGKDKNDPTKKDFKHVLGKEKGRTHLPRRKVSFPVLRNNITHEIRHNLSNFHNVVEKILSSTKDQITNLKSSLNLRIGPNVTSSHNRNFELERNVKTLEKYAPKNKNNSNKISVEIIVLKEDTNNKSLSTVEPNDVSVAKDNRINSLKDNNQKITHGIKSQALEEKDVAEKNVITLAKSISVLQNASYNYNSGGAKSSLTTTTNKQMPPIIKNKLEQSQNKLDPKKDLQHQFGSNRTVYYENKIRNNFQQVNEISDTMTIIRPNINTHNVTIKKELAFMNTRKNDSSFRYDDNIKESAKTIKGSVLEASYSTNQQKYSNIEHNKPPRQKLRKNPNILPPPAILQTNNKKSNIIDFRRSDNYTKTNKTYSLGDISETKPLNYTGGNDAMRKTKVNNVTHIIKEKENIGKNVIVPKKKEIVRLEKNHIMPVRSNLYLKRFRECIRLGKRCRWS